MNGTVNKVFIDSSVIIETYKGNPKSFNADFFSSQQYEFYINEIVLSEVLYHYVGSLKLGSPLTVKMNGEIGLAIEHYNRNPFLFNYSFIASDSRLLSAVPALMNKYNLLPNDAINIASCLLNDIRFIATLDPDFEIPCKSEGIAILSPGNI